MLFELAEIQKIEKNVSFLQKDKEKASQLLINAYSRRQQVKQSFNRSFKSILKQSALLIHLFQQIEKQIATDSLLSEALTSQQIQQLLYNASDLPEWFQFVFSKQFQKQKKQIQVYAKKIFKLHDLNLRNRQLIKQHWNFQTLSNRYQALSLREKEQFDITQEIQSLKNTCKHSRSIFLNFLNLIIKNILTFLEESVQKSLTYSQNLNKFKVNASNNCLPQFNNMYQTKFHLQTRLTSPKNYIQDDLLLLKNSQLRKVKSNQNINEFFYRKPTQNNNKRYDTMNKNESIQENYHNISNTQRTKFAKESNAFWQRKNNSTQKNFPYTQRLNSPNTLNNSCLSKKLANIQKQNKINFSNTQIQRNKQYECNLSDKTRVKNTLKSTQNNIQQPIKFYRQSQKTIKNHCQAHCQTHCQNYCQNHPYNQHQQFKLTNAHCRNHDHLIENHCSKHCQKTQRNSSNNFNDYQMYYLRENKSHDKYNQIYNLKKSQQRRQLEKESYAKKDYHYNQANKYYKDKNKTPQKLFDKQYSRNNSIRSVRSEKTLQMKPYLYRVRQTNLQNQPFLYRSNQKIRNIAEYPRRECYYGYN